MTGTRPLGDALFREGASGPVLLGGRCRACGHVAFPHGAVCWACRAADPELVELGSRAELVCATRVAMATKNFAPGFVVGYVRLPQGPRLFSQLGQEVADRPTGTALRLEIGVLWTEDGVDVRGHRFVAEEAGRA